LSALDSDPGEPLGPGGALPDEHQHPPPGLNPQTLAEAYVPLAKKIARRLARLIPMDPDDIESAAMLGLVQAARAYRADVGPFAGFAAFRIERAVFDERRRVDFLSRDERRKVTIGRAEAPTHAAFEADGFGDVGTQVAGVYDAVALVSLERKLRHLTLKQAHVVRQHGLGGRLLKTVGAELGVTESRACQLFTEALARLRVLMADPQSPEYATFTPVEKKRVGRRLSQAKHRDVATKRWQRWASKNREHLASYRKQWAQDNVKQERLYAQRKHKARRADPKRWAIFQARQQRHKDKKRAARAAKGG
jgi:RNA polymerase sigma factor (sigma-70 family)